MDLQNIITENDFQIIGDKFQGETNLMRKSILGLEDTSACMVGHLIGWGKSYAKEHNGEYPNLSELAEYMIYCKESLSLSYKGKGLQYMLGAFVRQIKVKDSKLDKQEKGRDE